jgi:hypothetical protein
VNRSLDSAAALLIVTLVAAPAWGQVPLVVGSVRDQRGAPVEGALVSGRAPDGRAAQTRTDAAGTFALHGEALGSLLVTCRYCEPSRIRPIPGQPAVVIVRRYQALLADAPSNADLANLPYSHVESALGLHPFTLVSLSTTPYPGSTLSDRGLSSSGSLLIDDGVPTYDIVNGLSPYAFIPANYEQNAVFSNATGAFRYGDQAGGGIVALSPFDSGSDAEVATFGSSQILRASAGSDSSGVAAGSFSNDEESRQRTDLFADLPLPADESLGFTAGTEQARDYQPSVAPFAGSYSFTGATFSDPRALNLQVSATADRGNYAMSEDEYPISTIWSDSSFSAAIHTTGAVAGFADVATRASTGIWDSQALPGGLPRVGAMLAQTRIDAGFVATGSDYNVVAGVGAFWVNYSGGTNGISQPAKTAFVLPSVDAQLFTNGKLSLNLQGSGSFTLPTFVEQYQYSESLPMPVAALRNTTFGEALNYTDDSRLRLSFEQASESVNGAWTGTITSTGFAATWQVAPDLSLRAWTMHVTDTVPLYLGGLPYGGAAPTVNALWLTYDTGAGVRADVIYRRDLLEGAPFYHVDGSISGPLTNRIRWYTGAEDWLHRTFVDAGIRF